MNDCLASSLEGAETRAYMNPAFANLLLAAIDRALREAWKRMLCDKEDLSVIKGKPEPVITQRLCSRLNKIRINGGADGYDANTFERPHIGKEILNCKGEKVGKPDIVFAISGQPRPGVYDDENDAIFVECKLIESPGKNVGTYCDDGLVRFVNGSYGWRMPQGMMVAYVRTGQTLPNALVEGLGKYNRTAKLHTTTELKQCPVSRTKPLVYLTVHDRDWLLPENVRPGHIEVRHLWLSIGN